MLNFAIRDFIPETLRKVLWGDRSQWGLEIDNNDPCWKEWIETQGDFYRETQKNGIGSFVNDMGYSIMSKVELSNDTILEIGAGDMRHLKYWKDKPNKYIILDVHQDMMDIAVNNLKINDIHYESIMVDREQKLPLDDNSIDTIVSFYSLEHIYPLENYVSEMKRVLKPGGKIVGAIPAEGGLAWGLGRYLTSRRWVKKNTNINYDKLICWEHPNFSDDIIKILDSNFKKKKIRCFPFLMPLIDMNLVVQFHYINSK